MATKEIYRIGIQVGVDGVEESKQKLSAMEKYTQQAEKRLKMLNKITAGPTAKLKDQTSSAIDKINVRSKSLSRAVVSPTAKINDQATSKLDRISTTIKRLENSNITATLRISDQTDSYLNNVQAKSDRLKNTNINPTAKVSTQSSPDWNKTKSELMELDGEFRTANMSTTKYFNAIQENSKKADNAVSNNLNNIGKKFADAGENISQTGDKLTTRVTLPIVGIGMAAAKIGMDFESQMSRVKAISGATGDEFKQLHDQALQLGADTAFSAKQAAEGMENLASAGFSTSEIMSAMPGLLDLAASSGESLASSSDIAASTLRGFGLAASDAGHVADVLAKNASATNAAVVDTGEAMKYIAPVAQTAGWSLESVAASIGELANSGIKGSQAGTTLRAMFSRLAKPSDESAKAMAAMGFSAYDSQHKMKSLSQIINDLSKSTAKMTDEQKQNTIAQVFGEEAMSGILTLIKNGSGSLDELTQSYINSDGAAKEMASTMQDNAKSAIEQMTGSLETAAIKIEEAFAPKITEAANYVQDLANKFSELSPEQQDFYIKMALGAAAIGPVIKLIGGLTSGIGKLIGIGSKIGPLLGITTASGAGIALAAVAALGVGIAGVKTHNELMAKSFDTSTEDLSAWEKVINTLTGSTIKSKKELVNAGLAYEDFSDSLSSNFKNSVEDASKAFNKLKMTLAFDSRNGVNFSDSMSSDIKSQVDSIVKSAKDAVMNKRSEMQSTLSQLFNMGDGKIDDDESKVMDNIAEYQDSKFSTIQTLNENIYNTLNTAVAEHKKLTEEDIENIKNWTQQIQALQIESSTTNEADRAYASNQGKFEKRLGSMTADEALSSMKDAYGQIININQDAEDKQRDIISKAKALEPELNDAYSKALANGDTSKAEGLKSSIDLIEKKVTEAQDKLNNSVKERQDKTRDLWEAFYKTNENLRGQINEVNFTKFGKQDKDSQSDLSKMESELNGLADVTESGMVRIKNAQGYWHDVQVQVDQATGHIISAYDVTTGKVGGYSKEFADKSEQMYKPMYEAQEKLKTLMNSNFSIKLDEGNNLYNKTDDGPAEIIEKMEKVIELSNGYKLAIANYNGTQIKMEFDKDGTLQNYQDVLNAINGDKSSKAIVNVDVNDQDAMEKFKETTMAADQIPANKDVQIDSNADQVTSDISGTTEAINETPKTTDVWINDNVTQHLKGILNDLQYMVSHPWTAFVNVVKSAFGGNNSNNTKTEQDTYDENRTRLGGDGFAVGTNNAAPGIHPVAEKGFEIVFGQQNRLFKGGEKVLTHEHSKSFLQKLLGNSSLEYINKIKNGYATGTNNATPGIHPVAENDFEIIFGQQNRLFKSREKLLTNERSKPFSQNLRHDEQFQVQQGQFQLVQPQGKLVTVNVGDIPINVNGNQDNDGIVQEVVQKVGVKLKEALENIKK